MYHDRDKIFTDSHAVRSPVIHPREFTHTRRSDVAKTSGLTGLKFQLPIWRNRPFMSSDADIVTSGNHADVGGLAVHSAYVEPGLAER